MHNAWLVAKHQYRRTVVRRGFLLGTLAIPLVMAVVITLVIIVETRNDNNLPIGYVDHSGLLLVSRQGELPNAENRIQIIDFTDIDRALGALQTEEIQAFWEIPANYPETLETDLYYLQDPPSNDTWRDFDDFIRINLLSELPDEVRDRLYEGPLITVHDTSSNRKFSEEEIINIILPFLASFFFLIATMFAAGYMLQVVSEEKENRTMEIMITSVTPAQLIGGKASGLLAAALTQLMIYIIAGVIGLIIAAQFIPELTYFKIPWTYLVVMALFFFPAYALIASMMLAIGAAVTDVQQGQQISGILNLVFLLPLFLLPILFTNPNNPLIIIMTLFPTTAFLTISLRWGLGSVPAWQLVASWIILVSSAVFMVWGAARIFRAGMLRYGQALSFRRIFLIVRGK
jgi:ABC-2 type transport system permease protein